MSKKTIDHKQRKHSKFSASGSERWMNCAPSVYLEEKSPPSADNEFSIDGTKTHEVHESLLNLYNSGAPLTAANISKVAPHKEPERITRAMKSVKRIIEIATEYQAEIIPEKRIGQEFIHPEMFGTCDAVIPQHFGRLHIIDYKDGSGHIVDPANNTQLIQYALGWADHFYWNFKDVELHIHQPKAGTNWAKSWALSIDELKNFWVPKFHKAVQRAEIAEDRGYKPVEGSWCYWCRAKGICPVKKEKDFNKVTDAFESAPIIETKGGKNNGKEKEESRKEKEISKKEKSFAKAKDREEDFF